MGKFSKFTIGFMAMALGLGLGLGSARAQLNPELGEGEEPPPAGSRFGASGQAQSTGTWQPPTGQVDNNATLAPDAIADDGSFGGEGEPTEAPTAEADAEPEADPKLSDHARLGRAFGIGFFGTLTVPIMLCDAAAGGCPAYDNTASVLAPTLGVRYWLKRRMGLELAIGFHHSSGDTEVIVDSGTVSTTTLQVGPTVTAFALHAGLPLALADSGHFVFQVIPEVNFGIAGGSYEGATTPENWDLSGSMVEVGARIGAEIHFGFIHIPQLALQATIGLHLRHSSRSATQEGDLNAVPPIPKTTIDQSRTEFRTSLQGEPWDIFTGGITAIYYL